MNVELDGPGYLYEALAKQLAERIQAGEFAPNTPLPAEGRLACEYGVSLGTARHATRLLRERGLVVTIKSKGTYVVARANSGAIPPGAAPSAAP
ncbi:winged helix-turn-helix transcriptional regulator [Amycolatopsis sp. K13G38]|uniref:Winged helix-turn-helix transcriptional regulator n=1 Tax=Amycolatopsis acididurans TaxID=2724524 RepID=A0ABX1JIW4_9PSEU|nr:winged helix-turn-helix domain-containing protein [Amycolatopsis acididurans]NKQ58576.1 winged helix-turn-helix transcriptional regulator [Amycolatopsis acididurans]